MSEHDLDQESQQWYDAKSKVLESLLGEQHEMVMHAIFPYAAGGSLDLYYFEQSPAGTAIATLELAESPDEGPSNDAFKCYEMAMFTQAKLNLDEAREESTPFGKAHHFINVVLNMLGPYSKEAKLNRFDTCEFPADFEHVGGSCLVFDALGSQDDQVEFGLMVPIQIHRSEMGFAREHGGRALIEKLKAAGAHPFSDLDREPVV